MSNRATGIRRIIAWLALGFLLGAALGLLIGWVLWPIEYTEADPTILESSYQHDYALMVATAYSREVDLTLAESRLRSLGVEDPDEWFLSFTVDQILSGANSDDLQYLVRLASDLGQYSPVMEPYLPAGNEALSR